MWTYYTRASYVIYSVAPVFRSSVIPRFPVSQLNFVQDYGEVISVVLVTIVHYVGVASC